MRTLIPKLHPIFYLNPYQFKNDNNRKNFVKKNVSKYIFLKRVIIFISE